MAIFYNPMQEEISKKIQRIDELRKTIADAERELEEILNPQKVTPPANFSWSEEVKKVLQEHPGGASTGDLLTSLVHKFPDYKIERKNLNSYLAYLKKKGDVVSVDKARYRLANDNLVEETGESDQNAAP